MASDGNLSSKRRKNMLEESMISSSRFDKMDELPEHLVVHILSFLHIKEVIKTSILSKRWRFRWTSVFNLDIDDDNVGDKNGIVIARKAKRFTNWVDRVMLQFKPTAIKKFSLSLKYYTRVSRINKWVSAAVFRDVRDLTLYMIAFSGNPVDVAPSIFHCQTLESLTIIHGVVFSFPEHESVCFPNLKFVSFEEVDIFKIPSAEGGSVCFPQLKTLQLQNLCYLGKGDSVMKLVSNCPVLADLLIRRFVEDLVPNTDLCIPALSTVVIEFPSDDVVNRLVQIDSPIKCLKLYNWSPSNKVLVKKLDSLIDATLDIFGSGHYQEEQKNEFSKLVMSLNKVHHLSLSRHTVNVMRDSDIMIPTFCNLVQLEVDMECKDFCMLQFLLDKSINLRTLIINKTEFPPCLSEATKWTELSPETKCLVASLKSIEIRVCNCCADEVAVIKSVLKCAKVLKRVTIMPLLNAEPDGPDLLKRQLFNQEIQRFSRASAVVDFELF